MMKHGPYTTKPLQEILRQYGVETLSVEFYGAIDWAETQDVKLFDADGEMLDYELDDCLPGRKEPLSATLESWFEELVANEVDLKWLNERDVYATVEIDLSSPDGEHYFSMPRLEKQGY